jgi:hypothetical protein
MKELLQLRLYLMQFLLISGVGFTRNFIANIIKKVIGMDIYFNQNEILFRDYIKYLLGVRSAPKITSRGLAGQGAGTQASLTMLAINFARVLNVPYVHTPFSKIGHADRPVELWDRAWEAEFNLGVGETPAKMPEDDAVDFAKNFAPYIRCMGWRNIHRVFNITYKQFREKYYVNKAPRINSILVVGVHVRRGDVVSKDGSLRWTDLTDISKTISKVVSFLDKRKLKYRVELFSEGSDSTFSEVESLGVKLFLNADPLWTLRQLIEADILIMAKSNFSYVAAINSDGIKLYEPFYTPPLKGWLVRQPNGDFDERLFAAQLEALSNRLKYSLG